MEHTRLVPMPVKLGVWQRDRGRCVMCGSEDNLHFDHIIPFSRGGSSLTANNVQLLCARHNLEKRDRIAWSPGAPISIPGCAYRLRRIFSDPSTRLNPPEEEGSLQQ